MITVNGTSEAKASLQVRAIANKPNIEKLRFKNGQLLTWWYGPIQKSKSRNTVPNVFVIFREINNIGELGSYKKIPVALTHLIHVRIGTIWEDGKCSSEL